MRGAEKGHYESPSRGSIGSRQEDGTPRVEGLQFSHAPRYSNEGYAKRASGPPRGMQLTRNEGVLIGARCERAPPKTKKRAGEIQKKITLTYGVDGVIGHLKLYFNFPSFTIFFFVVVFLYIMLAPRFYLERKVFGLISCFQCRPHPVREVFLVFLNLCTKIYILNLNLISKS